MLLHYYSENSTCFATGGIIPQELLPRLFDLCLLDAVLARVQVQLDDSLVKPAPDAESSK